APRRPVHSRQDDGRIQFANMAESIFQHTLFDGYLCLRLQMLHDATPTHAKMGAARLHPLRRSAYDALGACFLVRRLASYDARLNPLTGQRSFNEYNLAIAMGNTSSLEIKRLDVQYIYIHD